MLLRPKTRMVMGSPIDPRSTAYPDIITFPSAVEEHRRGLIWGERFRPTLSAAVGKLLSSEIAHAVNHGIASAGGISGSVSQSVILKLSTSTNAPAIQSIGVRLASTLLMKRRFLGTLKGHHKDFWCSYEHF
jgi:hypothetical protein